MPDPGEADGEPVDPASADDSPGGDDPYGIAPYSQPVNAEAVAGIVAFCGIALRSADGSLVACSSADELERVRESFLKRKLALTEDDETLDGAIADVCAQMKDAPRKHRVVFYYLLAERFGKLADLAS
ncbi:MAG: DUF2853 family protein [Hyphomicrobiaceae bacterium]|nr:DUF2853 family protein [Hyphomicrobiaceae bacterium]